MEVTTKRMIVKITTKKKMKMATKTRRHQIARKMNIVNKALRDKLLKAWNSFTKC